LPTFKLTIAYEGTGFVGWQRQPSGTSIQGLLEDAFSELDGRPVAVTGAGRTDAGVHALGQVASVQLDRSIDAGAVVRAINVRLPPSVRVLDACEVSGGFRTRFDASAKTYRYRIWNAEVLSPFERAFAWHIPVPQLDTDAMSAAARLIEGKHDFAGFQAAGSDTLTSDRVVFSSTIAREPPIVTYEIRGDGFLRHMVRNIVGSLVDVGRGRQPIAWMADVLAGRDRAQAGRTAPAEGLFLVSVEYESVENEQGPPLGGPLHL
jgi:tRNA pseudouridine38-40 synthase